MQTMTSIDITAERVRAIAARIAAGESTVALVASLRLHTEQLDALLARRHAQHGAHHG